MNTQKLSNIPLNEFREFLKKSGCKKISKKTYEKELEGVMLASLTGIKGQ